MVLEIDSYLMCIVHSTLDKRVKDRTQEIQILLEKKLLLDETEDEVLTLIKRARGEVERQGEIQGVTFNRIYTDSPH